LLQKFKLQGLPNRARFIHKMLTDCVIDSRISINYPEEGVNTSGCCYRLLEVADPHLLNTLEENRNMWIRGGPDDDAVLCTETQTFRLRELVTSNMFLVIEKEKERLSGIIVGRPTSTLEVMSMSRPPGIDQLLKALKESPYNGGLDDDFQGNDLIHVEKIYENVQASFKEIEECLKQQGVMVIEGKTIKRNS
jgi:hypothetical protein